MVHRAPGPDADLQQRIDEAAIVIQPLHVRGAGSDRLNARPGDGKTLALLVKALGQCDVLRIEVVLIAGNVACHASPYFPRCMSESVPYRFTLAVLIPCAFHLVGGRGGAPKKAFGKTRPLYKRIRHRPGNLLCGEWRSSVAIVAMEHSACGCG